VGAGGRVGCVARGWPSSLTLWRLEGAVRISGDLEWGLPRDCARELAAALVVADRVDAFGDERYGTAAAAACGREG
jgi:hypothetical protein